MKRHCSYVNYTNIMYMIVICIFLCGIVMYAYYSSCMWWRTYMGVYTTCIIIHCVVCVRSKATHKNTCAVLYSAPICHRNWKSSSARSETTTSCSTPSSLHAILSNPQSPHPWWMGSGRRPRSLGAPSLAPTVLNERRSSRWMSW